MHSNNFVVNGIQLCPEVYGEIIYLLVIRHSNDFLFCELDFLVSNRRGEENLISYISALLGETDKARVLRMALE